MHVHVIQALCNPFATTRRDQEAGHSGSTFTCTQLTTAGSKTSSRAHPSSHHSLPSLKPCCPRTAPPAPQPPPIKPRSRSAIPSCARSQGRPFRGWCRARQACSHGAASVYCLTLSSMGCCKGGKAHSIQNYSVVLIHHSSLECKAPSSLQRALNHTLCCRLASAPDFICGA